MKITKEMFESEKLNQLNEFYKESEIGMLSEAQLSRILSKIDSGVDFAIISGCRYMNSKAENAKRNNQLLKDLRNMYGSKKFGAYKLVGHWKECSEEISDEESKDLKFDEYRKLCISKGGHLIDALESSWFITIPEGAYNKTFDILLKLAKKYEQNAFIARNNGKISVYSKTGEKQQDFQKSNNAKDILSNGFMRILGQQGYNEFKKDRDRCKCRHLVFEMYGVVPDLSNSSHMLFTIMGINY